MARTSSENRRRSTIIRDNDVHLAYEELRKELGALASEVSRNYIYGRIHERTGLCFKTIAFVLNHTAAIDMKVQC